MKLALAFLSVVALSNAAPQNYTSHFQIFQASPTDPPPSSTNTTIDADGTNTTDKSTFDTLGNTSVGSTFTADDDTSDTGATTEVTSGSTHSTNSVTYTSGGVPYVRAGATSATEGTTVVTSATIYETTVTTETKFKNESTSIGLVKFGTSDFTHSPDDTTSTSDKARSLTDGSSYSRDGNTSSTGDAIGAIDTTVETTLYATYPTVVTYVSSGSTDRVTRTEGDVTRVTTGASNATDERTKAPIGVTTRSDVTSKSVESTTEEVPDTTSEKNNDESSTLPSLKTEGGTWTTTMKSTDHNRSVNHGYSTKNGSGEVEDPGFGFTFKLPAFFTTILESVSTIGSANSNTASSDTSINVHLNGGSDINSTAQTFNGVMINVTTKTTTTRSPLDAVSGTSSTPPGAQNNSIPSSSIEAASFNQSFFGSNVLSASDINNQPTPLHPEHLARVKKSLSKSEMRRNQDAMFFSGLHLNPDSYVPPFTVDGRDNSDEYDYDYYSQSFPPVRTSEEYVEDYLHDGNSGGYSGQLQYIIRTSNLPGELESFQTSSTSSALHQNSLDTYSFQGDALTSSHTDVGHVPLTSQPLNHLSLFPAVQSAISFNYAPNHRPLWFPSSLVGSSAVGPQHTNADSAFVTQKPVETFNLTTTITSISSSTRHQQKKADSFFGTQRPNETYYLITTVASIIQEENDPTVSSNISESPSNTTRSPSTTISPLFHSSKLTTEMINSADLVTTATEGIDEKETYNPIVGTNKFEKNS